MDTHSKSLRCLVGRHADTGVRLNPEDHSIVTQQCLRCGRVRDDDRFPQFKHDHRSGDTAWLINGQSMGGAALVEHSLKRHRPRGSVLGGPFLAVADQVGSISTGWQSAPQPVAEGSDVAVARRCSTA